MMDLRNLYRFYNMPLRHKDVLLPIEAACSSWAMSSAATLEIIAEDMWAALAGEMLKAAPHATPAISNSQSRFEAAKTLARQIQGELGMYPARYIGRQFELWCGAHRSVAIRAQRVFWQAYGAGKRWGKAAGQAAYQRAEAQAAAISIKADGALQEFLRWEGFREGARRSHPALQVERWLSVSDAATTVHGEASDKMRKRVQYEIYMGRLIAHRIAGVWAIPLDNLAEWGATYNK